MHFRFLDFFFRLGPRPAAPGHMEEVEHQTDRIIQAAAKTHDVIRDFVHGINAERQREIVRRGE